MSRQIICEMFLLGDLGLLSVIDIRKRQIPILLLLPVVMIWIISRWGDGWKEYLVDLILAGIVFAGFWAVSRISGNALGEGDAYAIGCIVLYCGLIRSTEIVLLSFLICALTGLLLLCLKRIKKTDALPFLPFLFLGSLGVFVFENSKYYG